jgi:D-aspartate ligase
MRPTPVNAGAVILGGAWPVLGATRCLANHGIEVCVLGAPACVASFSRSVNRFIAWPRGLKDEDLVDYLIAIAARHRMEGWVIFPVSDSHLSVLARQHARLAKHYVLTIPPWDTVKFLHDKRLTCALAQGAGVAVPRTEAPGSADRLAALDIEFPVVLKPAFTSSFQSVTNLKAYRANNRQELQRQYEKMARLTSPSEIIVQELLPDPSANLFSFAGYFKHGEPMAGLAVKRARQLPRDFGTSTFVEVIDATELGTIASRLLRKLHYTGLAEVEFMWDAREARYKLLEVNARLWAWQGLAVAAGLDLPHVAFEDALGRHPAVGVAREGAKFVRLLADVCAAAPDILMGRLSPKEYLAWFRRPTTFSVFAKDDPLPALVAPILMVLGRLKRLENNFKLRRRRA